MTQLLFNFEISVRVVDALRKISQITYPYCRGCRSKTANRLGHSDFARYYPPHADDCTCASCNEPCEEECPRGMAREVLEDVVGGAMETRTSSGISTKCSQSSNASS